MSSKNYKIPKENLNIAEDLAFINNVLSENQVEADPEIRGVLLDIAYTLARDKLLEARIYANVSNKVSIDQEDLRCCEFQDTMEELQETELLNGSKEAKDLTEDESNVVENL